MNCENLISKMGFECQHLGEEVVRIWSPFTYGTDGELVGLYVERVAGGYRVFDNSEAVMHASASGVQLTKSRLEKIRQIAGPSVTLAPGGELFAVSDDASLPTAIAAVLNASMSVGHLETLWLPRTRGDSFLKYVDDVLTSCLGPRLLRAVKVEGASGHQLELPFAVVKNEVTSFIQPIASDENRIDWTSVYSGFGKMMDLKNAGAPASSRIIVLEDAANDSEVGKAITVLNGAASVVRSSALVGWAHDFALTA